MTSHTLKQEFIQEFGEAYHAFGLPKLMGRIVGLLLYSREAISLDDMANELGMSKGPISQITRRLKDHNLILRVWIPGERKDFYKADPNIFGNAFRNHMTLMKNNLFLAQKFKSLTETSADENGAGFIKSINEMEEFYSLMLQHYKEFLNSWETR